MPPIILARLKELGFNLMISRKRRCESRKVWAQRIGVCEATLKRMEDGDPSVSMGVYASALWLLGRVQAIPDLAAAHLDLGALEREVNVAMKRSVRKPFSASAKLDVRGPKH